VLGENGFERLDQLSSTGVAVSADGALLARLLWSDADTEGAGELLLYDACGLLGYRRVDALREAHGALWHEGHLLAVSTLTNSVLRLDETGSVTHTWSAPGEGDCWHLNNLLLHHGRLLVSAFGRFAEHRGWSEPSARDGSGVVFDMVSGEDVLSGLTCPHDPLALDGGWLVCNSGTGELWRCAPDGAVLARHALGGWTRGLTYDAEHVYVGVSAHRLLGLEGTAAVAVLDRATLCERARWALPCREVFALVFAPASLVAAQRSSAICGAARLKTTKPIAKIATTISNGASSAAQLPRT
jgi:hypothetical protein